MPAKLYVVIVESMPYRLNCTKRYVILHPPKNSDIETKIYYIAIKKRKEKSMQEIANCAHTKPTTNNFELSECFILIQFDWVHDTPTVMYKNAIEMLEFNGFGCDCVKCFEYAICFICNTSGKYLEMIVRKALHTYEHLLTIVYIKQFMQRHINSKWCSLCSVSLSLSPPLGLSSLHYCTLTQMNQVINELNHPPYLSRSLFASLLSHKISTKFNAKKIQSVALLLVEIFRLSELKPLHCHLIDYTKTSKYWIYGIVVWLVRFLTHKLTDYLLE